MKDHILQTNRSSVSVLLSRNHNPPYCVFHICKDHDIVIMSLPGCDSFIEP